jgi:lantibiotic modifying enzyme
VCSSDLPSFATGWCHGAPGIALARLATPSLLADPIVCAEVDAAIDTTCACGAGGLDHPCCGTMGRIDTLLLAARVRGRPELAERARRTAARVVMRARQAGDYRFPGLAAGDLHPGLFTGLAGIGHQLLRLRDPDAVPSMLLWSRSDERTPR